jgi:hypothetical protein
VAQAASADARAADLAPVVQELREAGVTSLAALARAFTSGRYLLRAGQQVDAIARTLARL